MFEVAGVVAGICAAFTVLYFSHVIPPVPLSLKHIGVYHTLERVGGVYAVSYEKPAWYVFWRHTDAAFTLSLSEGRAYCFSAIFAPGGLSTPVVHQWEKYDPTSGKWQQQSKYSFPINGGRDQGYRGWTAKTLSAGKWRCDVETENGQLIGRLSFEAVEAGAAELSTTTL